jgi:hypothetical protein
MEKTFDDLLGKNLPMHVRNNHALEHATLHVLQQKGNNSPFGGISDIGGFWIYGEIEADQLMEAAQEALQRLTDGEDELAIHPNCGTNIAVGALAGGGLAWLSMLGTKGKFGKRLRRLPVAAMLALLGYQLARPYGPILQEKITTNADIKGLKIVEVVKHEVMKNTVHRVVTVFGK